MGGIRDGVDAISAGGGRAGLAWQGVWALEGGRGQVPENQLIVLHFAAYFGYLCDEHANTETVLRVRARLVCVGKPTRLARLSKDLGRKPDRKE